MDYLPIGSILRVSLKFNTDHSGIYLGYGNVAELDGSGKIMVRSFDDFIKGDRTMRNGKNISVATDCSGNVLAKPEIVRRAIKSLCQIRDYDVVTENCHRFTAGCITGNFKKDITFFSDLEEVIRKYFSASSIFWKSIGSGKCFDFKKIGSPRIFLADFDARKELEDNASTPMWQTIISNFLLASYKQVYHSDEDYLRMLASLMENMPLGFSVWQTEQREMMYQAYKEILNKTLNANQSGKTIRKMYEITQQYSYDDIVRVRNIGRLAMFMSRAGISDWIAKPEEIYSYSKIKDVVNTFDPNESMVEFAMYLEEELGCPELPVEAFISYDDTVGGLYDSMKQFLPKEIFERLFGWNDPVIPDC